MIDTEGFRARMPVRGRKDHIEIEPRKLPGKVSAAAANNVDPRKHDLVGLALQEPQYAPRGVSELLAAVANSRVRCISIMNRPSLPYRRRIQGLETDLLKSAYTAPEVWDDFDPGTLTLCSPYTQAVRPSGENVLQVTQPTDFKVTF